MRVYARFLFLYLLIAGCSSKEPFLEAPTDFGFIIQNHVSTINSFEHYYKRKFIKINRANSNTELIINDTTAVLRLNKQELDSAYNQFRKINFFTLPEKVVDDCPDTVPRPGMTTITVRSGGLTKQVRFVICWGSKNEERKNTEVENFLNLVGMMAYRQPQIVSLPKSNMNTL